MNVRRSIKEVLKDLVRPSSPPTERQSLNEVAAVNPPDLVPSDRFKSLPIGFIFSEFHMTIRLKIDNVTTKQVAMLLKVANTKAVQSGVNVQLYLTIEYLYSLLLKSGHDPLYMQNEKDRQSVLLAELILSATRGQWLSFEDKEQLPVEVTNLIKSTGWLPSDRTLNSWRQHWNLESYLQLRIVPVDIFLERQPNSAERYSGYTKGYGQDGSPTAPHKTKDEPLDGSVDARVPEFTLLDFEHYQSVLSQIEREKSAKKRK